MRQVDKETTFCHPSTVVYAGEIEKESESKCVYHSKQTKKMIIRDLYTHAPQYTVPVVIQFIENKLKNFSLGYVIFFHPCVFLSFAFPIHLFDDVVAYACILLLSTLSQ